MKAELITKKIIQDLILKTLDMGGEVNIVYVSRLWWATVCYDCVESDFVHPRCIKIMGIHVVPKDLLEGDNVLTG